MNFPQFRKLKNNKSYYRIDSAEFLTEVAVMGNSYMIHEVHAKILPDRNLLRDLLHNEGGHWVEIDEKEFDSFLSQCERELVRR